MAKRPAGQHPSRCSKERACPHRVPGHYGRTCRGFVQGITEFAGWTIYHCKYDPPPMLQVKLPLD